LNSLFSIRPATADDLVRVVAIETKVHVAPWTLDLLSQELTKPQSQFWVLTDDETDEKVIGYIVFWKIEQECQILNVAVDLEFRGLGVGERLVRECVNWAMRFGCIKVFLEVRKSNAGAQALYNKVGFHTTHIRKTFYSNGEDALVLALDLTNTVQF
jgi:ribosomal-protein-alanine N-acetyltransferase